MPTAYTRSSCRAHTWPSLSSIALTPRPVSPLQRICSQILTFCMEVLLAAGLEFSAQLYECMLLKNGERRGEHAYFRVPCCNLFSLSADCTFELSCVLSAGISVLLA